MLGVCLVCLVYEVSSLYSSTPIDGTALPYYQTFDSWDECFYDGVCYEKQCNHLRGNMYNPLFVGRLPNPPGAIRHWWVKAGQTPSNWDSTRKPVACGSMVTGPCNDHTFGNSSGKYLYAESSACFGVAFHVITPSIAFTNTTKSVAFKYFFFGADLKAAGANPAKLFLDYTLDNATTWNTITTITANAPTSNVQASSTAAWNSYNSGSLDATLGASPVTVIFRLRALTAGIIDVSNLWKGDLALDDLIITQDGAPPPTVPYVDFNCTATGTCGPPLQTTSGGGVTNVSKGDGDGLTDGEIAGIVIGIVGGALFLCCLLLCLLLLLLLLISPRKPPSGDDGL